MKSQIGHTKAAAGAAGLIKAALALYHKVLPPHDQGRVAGGTACATPTRRSTSTPRCGRGRLARTATRAARRCRRSASAGRTSTRCSKSTARPRAEPDWDGSVELLALGAPTRRGPRRPGRAARPSSATGATWPAGPGSRAGTFDPRAGHRLVFVLLAKDGRPLADLVPADALARAARPRVPRASWPTERLLRQRPGRAASWACCSQGKARSRWGCCASWRACSPRCSKR